VRAVLDANVYVSALLTPHGVSGRIVERFLRDASFEIVLSPDITDEALRVFGYPKLKRYLAHGVAPAQWFGNILVRALGACPNSSEFWLFGE
jgi:putative PIN family toxin of toxin-antitoxin system